MDGEASMATIEQIRTANPVFYIREDKTDIEVTAASDPERYEALLQDRLFLVNQQEALAAIQDGERTERRRARQRADQLDTLATTLSTGTPSGAAIRDAVVLLCRTMATLIRLLIRAEDS